MDEKLASSVINQVIRAINFAHDKGIIHLNLSPSQIMMSETDTVDGKVSIRVKGWGMFTLFDINAMICGD